MTLEFKGIGGHQSNQAATDEWLTPPFVLAALGGAGSFDLDPCTPDVQPWPTARHRYTRADNGLMKPWFGRVWLNPPYYANVIGRWLARLAEHGRGSTIIFARTETTAFFDCVWERASGVLFLRGRLHFHVATDTWFKRKNRPPLFVSAGGRAPANSGAPSVICAYGPGDLDVLAGCGLAGKFVPLRFPRGLLVALFADADATTPSWREAITDWLRAQDGPVKLDQVYAAFAGHAKTRTNRHWREKIRQTLQRAARRTGPGEYESQEAWSGARDRGRPAGRTGTGNGAATGTKERSAA